MSKDRSYIAEVMDPVPAKPYVKEVAVCNCKHLNIRSSPLANASIASVVSEGTRLKVLTQPEPMDQWVHISTEDKKPVSGYVMRQYVRVI